MTPIENTGSQPRYPELFVSADAASTKAQASYVRSTILQLGLLVLAALSGSISIHAGTNVIDWAKIVATAAFLLGAILQAQVAATKPDRMWYESRAAAESAKTLAWRYAVGGEPLGLGTMAAEADTLFLARIQEVMQPLGDLPLIPATERIEQITGWMRDLRAEPLQTRRTAYERDRLEEAERWYRQRATHNAGRANFWSKVMVSFQVIGALGALLTGSGALGIRISISALAATAVGVTTGWVRTKQYGSLASAYAVTARELADVRIVLPLQNDEGSWAKYVGDAEGAISREHTLWRSARTHSSSI